MVDPLLIRVPWLLGAMDLSLGGRLAQTNFASNTTQFGNDAGLDLKRLGKTEW